MTILKLPAVIDISHWETIPDWTKLDKRVCGVIMKATQGKYYIDPTFRSSWNGTRAIKVPASAYHFFDANDVPSQVANYLTACEDVGIIVSGKWMAEIEPVFDAEYQNSTSASTASRVFSFDLDKENASSPTMSAKKMMDLVYPDKYLAINRKVLKDSKNLSRKGSTLVVASEAASVYLTPAQLAEQYRVWLVSVESELGIRPIIYTSSWQWSATGNPAWAKNYKLWTAQYPYNPDGQTAPKYFPYGGWTEFWAWQYAADFMMEGINGQVDVNQANCTQEEWNNLYGGVYTPPIGGDMLIATNKDPLNLRSTPSSANNTNVIELMPANTHIEGTEIITGADGSKWLKTVLPHVGYCASWLLTYETIPPVASDVVVKVIANDTLEKYSETFPAGTRISIEVL